MHSLFTVPASQIYQVSNSCFSGVFSGSILEFLGESNSNNGVGSTEMRNKMKFNELWPRTLIIWKNIGFACETETFLFVNTGKKTKILNSGYNTVHYLGWLDSLTCWWHSCLWRLQFCSESPPPFSAQCQHSYWQVQFSVHQL